MLELNTDSLMMESFIASDNSAQHLHLNFTKLKTKVETTEKLSVFIYKNYLSSMFKRLQPNTKG